MSESLETISSATNSLKTTVDQKSCQIINKTSTVLDKVKSQAEDLKTIAEKSKMSYTKEQDNIATICNSTREKKSNVVSDQANKKRLKKPRAKKAQHLQKQKPSPPVANSINDTTTETIDLTKPPKTVIKQSILVAGSSILKGIHNNGLKANATVRSFPDATVESLTEKLENMNIDNCKTVILHVVGNDADAEIDLDTFSEDYTTLLSNLTLDDRKIIVSGLLLRESVDLEPYNDRLRSLCSDNDIVFIDHFGGFLLASGELPSTYFMKDKTHPNASGTRKLLQSIDKHCKITRSSEPQSTPLTSRQHTRPPVGRGYKQKGYKHVNANYCHICSMNNHSTNNCWFNGRSNGMPRRQTARGPSGK